MEFIVSFKTMWQLFLPHLAWSKSNEWSYFGVHIDTMVMVRQHWRLGDIRVRRWSFVFRRNDLALISAYFRNEDLGRGVSKPFCGNKIYKEVENVRCVWEHGGSHPDKVSFSWHFGVIIIEKDPIYVGRKCEHDEHHRRNDKHYCDHLLSLFSAFHNSPI